MGRGEMYAAGLLRLQTHCSIVRTPDKRHAFIHIKRSFASELPRLDLGPAEADEEKCSRSFFLLRQESLQETMVTTISPRAPGVSPLEFVFLDSNAAFSGFRRLILKDLPIHLKKAKSACR